VYLLVLLLGGKGTEDEDEDENEENVKLRNYTKHAVLHKFIKFIR